MEEEEKTTYEEIKRIIAAIEVSPMNVDLTTPKGGVPQDSPKSGDVHEDVVKKVRFSDHKTTEKIENLIESCVRTILNTSEEEEEFHDAHDETNAQKAKATAEDNGAKNAVGTNNVKDTCVVEDAKDTNDDRAEAKKRVLMQPSGTFLNDLQVKTFLDNAKNVQKENRDPGLDKEDSSIGNRRDSNTVLMMVLMKNNSGGLTSDLMPLISSGLKKFQEQLKSSNCQSPSSAAESKVCRRSITTMKMSVSSVESYSANSAATNQGLLTSSSVQNENSSSNGFLSAITQIMKHALRSLSSQ